MIGRQRLQALGKQCPTSSPSHPTMAKSLLSVLHGSLYNSRLLQQGALAPYLHQASQHRFAATDHTDSPSYTHSYVGLEFLRSWCWPLHTWLSSSARSSQAWLPAAGVLHGGRAAACCLNPGVHKQHPGSGPDPKDPPHGRPECRHGEQQHPGWLSSGQGHQQREILQPLSNLEGF